MNLQVGFIGVGNMGGPMACNLLQAGIEVKVYDLDQGKTHPLVALGAIRVGCPGDAVAPGGLVLSMVPHDAALERIVNGSDGILAQIGAGGIHISCSTISPTLAKALAARYQAQGSSLVIATVSGRPDVAAAALLSIFYAGPPSAKERALPVLQVLGKRLYDLGVQPEAAAACKLAINHLIASIILALADSAALAEKCGIPPASFIRLVRESPLFAGKVFEYGDMIAADTYRPALFPVPLGIKDIQLMLEASAAVGMCLPNAERFLDCLRQADTFGRSQEDWAVAAWAITRPSKEAYLPSATGSNM